jgi:hypothetical protein
MKKLFLLSFILLFTLFACSDSGSGDSSVGSFDEICSDLTLPAGLTVSINGDTLSSMTVPEATAFITCTSTCADDISCMMECMSTSGISEPGGSFSIAMTLTNSTGSSIDYTISPGVWFDPDSGDNQPMMIFTTKTITVAGGATLTETLPVFCLVMEKSAPDEAADIYSVCDIVNSGCIADITNILKTKDLTVMPYSKIEQIQNIVWKCTDGSITQSDLDLLNAL